MKYIKSILIGLLLIFPIVLIFNKPGLPNLENFYRESLGASFFPSLLIKYPPGIYLVLNSILKSFPPDNNIYFFFNQSAWVVSKVILTIVYYLTLVSIIYFAKSLRNDSKNQYSDLILAFLGSVSILLSSLALAFFEILAIPFFILALSFLFRKRFNLSAIFFLLALCFNWTTLISGPLFFIYFLQFKKFPFKKFFLPVLSFVCVPLFLFSFYLTNISVLLKSPKFSSDIFSFTWLFNSVFRYISAHNTQGSILINPGFLITIFITVLSIILLFYFIKRFVPLWVLIIFLSVIVIFVKTNFVLVLLISFFLSTYSSLLFKLLRQKTISRVMFLGAGFALYLVFTLFFPTIPNGNLIWLVIFSLITFIVKKSSLSKLQLLAINLLVFMNYFVLFGSAGVIPVRGNYFFIFHSFFAFAYVIYSFKYLISFDKYTNKRNYYSLWLKKFLIAFMILVNFSLLTADGTGDNVSFNDTALRTVKYLNPFKAHATDPEMYPPLSTFIIGTFANASKVIVGETENYRLAVKTSVIFFYFLSLFTIYKISEKLKGTKIKTLNKVLIMLTTFSLIIQTQGFSDINIYVIPTLAVAILALFGKRYLLSGLLLGLTLTIKPQPIFILPLFGATIFTLKDNFVKSLRKIIIFITGLLTVPLIVWTLVIVNPGGIGSFYRFLDYLFNTSGFHLLSGQALNFNWVATYILHIVRPERHYSLEYLGWLNWQIPSDYAPFILRGIFFYVVAFFVFISYWLKKKKSIINFLGASVIVFFTHFILNKSAHEKHFFYTTIFMLFLFLLKPSSKNRSLLFLFDAMNVISLIFFYGFTGPKDINRLFLNFDLTVLFASFYVFIYFCILFWYWKGEVFQENEKDKPVHLDVSFFRRLNIFKR